MSNYKTIMEIDSTAVKGVQGECICDKCKNPFKPEETLVEKRDNIDFQGILGIMGKTEGKKTWYLISPCCKKTHLYGFDMKT